MEQLHWIEKGIKALQQSQLETEAQLKKTDAQLALNAIQLAETKRILSGIGINIGEAAEDFFENSLQENKVLGNVRFDSIAFGLHSQKGKVQDEFDIVMYNGDSVAIIEVKHKAHSADLENLLTKKLQNFRTLFPRFADMHCYLGLAAMRFPKKLAEQAEEAGVAVLRQKGDVLVMNKNLRAF
jgi:hypothetical protein